MEFGLLSAMHWLVRTGLDLFLYFYDLASVDGRSCFDFLQERKEEKKKREMMMEELVYSSSGSLLLIIIPMIRYAWIALSAV